MNFSEIKIKDILIYKSIVELITTQVQVVGTYPLQLLTCRDLFVIIQYKGSAGEGKLFF